MEKFDLERFPTSESAKKMLSFVSDGFYDESYVGKWIFQVMGIEYDKALEIAMDLPAQFFLETATWGLLYHEIKWGLPVRLNLSYEERRRLIYQKRDYRAPMTPYRIEKHLESMTGLEIHINDVNDKGRFNYEFPNPNVFLVTVIGDSKLNLGEMRRTLDRLKQSHTVYDIDVIESRYEIEYSTFVAIVSQTKKTYLVEVL
nr:putative phage tail protein [uncultured Acetatifactor sp.]